MTFRDIVAQMFERGNAMQTFWGFYISISIGLIAFFGNAKRTPRLPAVAALLSLAFVVFAVINCDGMRDIAAQRWVFFTQLRGVAEADRRAAVAAVGIDPAHRAGVMASIAGDLAKISRPPTPDEILEYHIIADCLVLGAIWTLCLWKDRKTLDQKKDELIKEILDAG